MVKELTGGFGNPPYISDVTRRDPLITRVLPPIRPLTGPAMKWFVFAVIFAVGCTVVPLALIFPGYWILLVITGVAVLVSVLGTVFWVFARKSRERVAEREKLLARFPKWADDPVAAMLSDKWKRGMYSPTPDVVLNVVREAPVPQPPRGRIIVLGNIDVPEIGDYRFEPVIITPTRFLWKRLWFVPIALAIVAFWAAQKLHLIPGNVPVGSFGYLIFMGIAMVGVWVWRTTIRPTYLRLAPGMVQAVEFGLGKRKPTIRSFPMSPGTVAIAMPRGNQREPSMFWLARGENLEQIPLWQMQYRDEASEHLWHALLSTAPTPPLSDEELLG